MAGFTLGRWIAIANPEVRVSSSSFLVPGSSLLNIADSRRVFTAEAPYACAVLTNHKPE